MNKSTKVFLMGAVTLLAMPAVALDCAYAPEQEIVRSAENDKEFSKLGDSFDANATFPCGGTLSQLAVLRGNLDTLIYLYKHGANFTGDVSLKGYEIPGAPDEIPFPFFVARYAPNSAMMDAIVNMGINLKVKDSLGHDIFWYLEQNPVLRRSYLTKKGWDSLVPMQERIKKMKESKM